MADSAIPPVVGSVVGGWVAAFNTVISLINGRFASRPYRWANSSARTAQAGMTAGEVGYQVDTATVYRWNGTGWWPDRPTLTRRYRNAALNFTSTAAAIDWDAASVTPAPAHFTYAAGVLTCTRAGLYEIEATVSIGAVATGWILAIETGAGATLKRWIGFGSASGSTSGIVSLKKVLAVNDTIRVTGFASSTVAISAGSDLSALEVTYLGDS